MLLASGRGKPAMASLRRATSSTYYAIFLCLARECADLLIGGTNSGRSQPAWRQVYRALEHGWAKTQCKNSNTMKKFPKEIEDFADFFVNMQERRHQADYDPFAKFTKSEVQSYVVSAERAIAAFKKAPTKDRRAFCAYVILKDRRS